MERSVRTAVRTYNPAFRESCVLSNFLHLFQDFIIGHLHAEAAMPLDVHGVICLAPPIVVAPPVVSLQATNAPLGCHFFLAPTQVMVFLRGLLKGPPDILLFRSNFCFQCPVDSGIKRHHNSTPLMTTPNDKVDCFSHLGELNCRMP
jgi:hypothetical protein